MTDTPQVPWTILAVFTVAGLCLIGIGGALGILYCQYRHDAEVQELTRVTRQAMNIGEACVPGLVEVSRAAVIFARTQPRPVAIRPAIRDSLREARWSTPP